MRISTTRTEVTVLGLVLLTLIALAVSPAWWTSAFGQEVTSTESNVSNRATIRGDGQKATIEGIVIERDGNRFMVRETGGAEIAVVVTDKTEIKAVRKGLFRRDRIFSANQIVPGLRLTVAGKGNAEGQLVAGNVRFDEQDLRTAQSLESHSGSQEKTAVVQLTNAP